jgi:hypothetical protein
MEITKDTVLQVIADFRYGIELEQIANEFIPGGCSFSYPRFRTVVIVLEYLLESGVVTSCKKSWKPTIYSITDPRDIILKRLKIA